MLADKWETYYYEIQNWLYDRHSTTSLCTCI